MATTIFLVLSAALWLPYGIYCFVVPEYLGEAAGVAAASTTGTIEIRAMYGGLQAAIGTLALAALFRASLRRPALVCALTLCAGLAVARLAAAIELSEFSGYTVMGLGFEVVTVAYAMAALRSEPLGASA